MATQFLGEYEVPVDDKGRIFLPAELRRNLDPEADEVALLADHGLEVFVHVAGVRSTSPQLNKSMGYV